MAMAAMNMVSAVGFSGVSFKKMSAWGRLFILQENGQFWVPTIKVRPPDGSFCKMVPFTNKGLIKAYRMYPDYSTAICMLLTVPESKMESY